MNIGRAPGVERHVPDKVFAKFPAAVAIRGNFEKTLSDDQKATSAQDTPFPKNCHAIQGNF